MSTAVASLTVAALLHEGAWQLASIAGEDARLEPQVLPAHAARVDRGRLLACLSEVQGDLLASAGEFDIILANLPYVSEAEWSAGQRIPLCDAASLAFPGAEIEVFDDLAGHPRMLTVRPVGPSRMHRNCGRQ